MPDSDFDLIVIGAGSSGAAIASFTTVEPGLRVLVVEAGPDYPDPNDLPADLVNANDNSYLDHDWGLRYRPGSEAQGGQHYPRGRVVGGSSAVNTCIALRGDRADYDEWARLAGDHWSFDDCLPYLIGLENDREFGDAEYHGDSGPLPVMRYRADDWVPLQRAVVDACVAAGYERCDDFNDPDASTGAGAYPMNKIVADLDGTASRRVSSAAAWLTADVRSRPNLTIRANSLVRRVVFESGQVAGIEIADGRSSQFVRCRNVVLSAGAVMTPAILARSGIGPSETLERISVAPVSVLEGVGRLYEHPACIAIAKAVPGVVEPGEPLIQTMLRWTSALMSDEGETGANDMQLESVSYLPGTGAAFVGLNSVVERSFSQGWVKVMSAEPSAHPVIEPELLSDERDLERMIEGIRLVMELITSSAMADVVDSPYSPKLDEVAGSDEDARAWARRRVFSGFHPAGSARMGHEDDPMAVVDGFGRVRGVSGLRVADASIMPMIIRSNLNVTSMMIGMRFGEWMREELTG